MTKSSAHPIRVALPRSRDFTSVSQVVATRYEVLVEHKLLGQAQELLQAMPNRPQPVA